jgi:hypothetical protein
VHGWLSPEAHAPTQEADFCRPHRKKRSVGQLEERAELRANHVN